MNNTYIIYADVLLVWNCLQNIISCFVAGVILDRKIFIKKAVIISIVTALGDTVLFVEMQNNNIIYQILYSFLHVFMFVFLYRIKCIIELIVIFIASVLVGGSALATLQKFDAPGFMVYALCLSLVFIMLFLSVKYYRAKKQTAESIYEINIFYKDKTITVKAFYDTGNMLVDPYSGNPVIIMGINSLNLFFGKYVKKISRDYMISGIFDYQEIYRLTRTHFYPLSYKTISNQTSIMPAFRPSGLKIADKEIFYDRVTVGFSRFEITKDNSYSVLLNKNLKPIREENSND